MADQYKEVQRFRRWEILLPLFLLLLFTIYNIYESAMLWDFRTEAHLWKGVLALLILGGVLTYLLSIRLLVKVDTEKIKFQYFPLHRKKQKIYWDEVAHYEVLNLPLSVQLSGWGVHVGERMFCVKPGSGIRLHLKDGQKIFISCKDPEAIAQVLRTREASA
ncbi:MAG: hypothetical protein RIC19_14135 [Phaeodactylibacter sp.]|uniref:hypothetical protein n=1 Tax=Phaeodactylibacter sp. TaxID=1940289 RepID=UPI0032EF5BDF